MHIFSDMGYLVERFMAGLEDADLVSLGRLMNIHQLLQEKMAPLVRKRRPGRGGHSGGALGAKISGSGCGGIVIALCQPGHEEQVAASMEAAGARVTLSAPAKPVRVRSPPVHGARRLAEGRMTLVAKEKDLWQMQ